MFQVVDMLNTHAQKQTREVNILASCVQECFDCAEACTVCADACMSEQMIQELRECIRLNQDCADICNTTGRVLSRQTQPDWRVMRAQIMSCMEAVGACARSCEQHSGHEHCRMCAERCRSCEASCRKLLESIPEEVTH